MQGLVEGRRLRAALVSAVAAAVAPSAPSRPEEGAGPAEMARREGVTISGYRLVVNNGAAAGQTIAWPHVHLLGGRELGAMG